MHVSVDKPTDDPIYVITYQGHMSEGINPEQVAQVRSVLQQASEAFYLIVDLRQADRDFTDILAFAKQLPGDSGPSRAASMAPAHPPVFVGLHPFIQLVTKQMLPKMFGIAQAPVFQELDEAIAYLQHTIAQKILPDQHTKKDF
ncbi:MAG: hypothetical protein MUF87_14025 [Anaerolineae bacterium]|jgi:hypothetical protein|nr:hypothetical protein [Anaerolineae bacterium]